MVIWPTLFFSADPMFKNKQTYKLCAAQRKLGEAWEVQLHDPE